MSVQPYFSISCVFTWFSLWAALERTNHGSSSEELQGRACLRSFFFPLLLLFFPLLLLFPCPLVVASPCCC